MSSNAGPGCVVMWEPCGDSWKPSNRYRTASLAMSFGMKPDRLRELFGFNPVYRWSHSNVSWIPDGDSWTSIRRILIPDFDYVLIEPKVYQNYKIQTSIGKGFILSPTGRRRYFRPEIQDIPRSKTSQKIKSIVWGLQ